MLSPPSFDTLHFPSAGGVPEVLSNGRTHTWFRSDSSERYAMKRESGEFLGRFSPDSRFMAYLSDESERNQVWVRPFDSTSGTPPAEGKWRVSKDGGDSMIAWRADGKELYYLHNDVDTG